jgi:CRISPR/Cas system-associated exonuclease Cas4 (RecB family)
MKQRTHWTVSALKDFETCPAKYRWSYLFEQSDWREIGYEVVPSKGSPAMQRGTDIHQTCEDYLLGKVGIEGLHVEIPQAWRNLISGLKHFEAKPEEQWEVEEGWHPVEGGAVWLRAKIDAHYFPSQDTLHVIDYKTGKPYRENIEQVEVYALLGFALFDDVQTVIGELWYLDHEEPHEKAFHRSQAPKLARKWEQRANRLLSAVKYPPRPNRFCDWCPYNEIKGGPCGAPAGSSR